MQDLTLNRVQVTTEGEVGGEAGRVPPARQKTYDLSPKDIFWKKHKGRLGRLDFKKISNANLALFILTHCEFFKLPNMDSNS